MKEQNNLKVILSKDLNIIGFERECFNPRTVSLTTVRIQHCELGVSIGWHVITNFGS